MAIDYDLVVIGNTAEAITAAVSAAHLKSRVALVEQSLQGDLGGATSIFSRSFTHTAYLSKQWQNADRWGLPSGGNFSLNGANFQAWVQEVIAILQEQNSPAILSALGVDFIRDSGEFVRRPHLAFALKNRKLRSRAYLIATGSHPATPNLPDIEKIGYLTPLNIWQEKWASLPQQLLIVGGTPLSLELAQSLGRLGKNVTLIVENQQLLPTEDEEVSKILQAQLEGEGVKVFTNSAVIQAKQIEPRKWVQASNQAIETDEVIWAKEQIPNVEGLNLEAVGVKVGKEGIQVNRKLQTTNPQIYACGSIIGGYSFINLAQYEAQIALRNALFLPIFTVDYHSIPWVIFTNPSLARVGLTEAQARRRYGKNILVMREYFKNIIQTQVLGETTGFCKLIARRNGEILGGHIVGSMAEEIIGALALAIRHKLKVEALADFIYPSLTCSEIIAKTALKWRQQKFNRNQTLTNFLEDFFLWRRKQY